MCVDSGIKRFNYQYKIISFWSRLVHLSNKKNVGEFFRSCLNVCIEVQKKRNLSCAVIYVLIKREIAVGLIPSVKTPPSPQKNWEESLSSPLFLKRGGCLYKLNNAESPKGAQEILNQHLGQAVLLFQRRIYSQQTTNKKQYDFLLWFSLFWPFDRQAQWMFHFTNKFLSREAL